MNVSYSGQSNGVPYLAALTTQQLMYVVIFQRTLYSVPSSTSCMESSPTCQHVYCAEPDNFPKEKAWSGYLSTGT